MQVSSIGRTTPHQTTPRPCFHCCIAPMRVPSLPRQPITASWPCRASRHPPADSHCSRTTTAPICRNCGTRSMRTLPPWLDQRRVFRLPHAPRPPCRRLSPPISPRTAASQVIGVRRPCRAMGNTFWRPFTTAVSTFRPTAASVPRQLLCRSHPSSHSAHQRGCGPICRPMDSTWLFQTLPPSHLMQPLRRCLCRTRTAHPGHRLSSHRRIR